MKFVFFHLMPWDQLDKANQDWPVRNRGFDPVAAADTYRTYIDSMVFAEECGFYAAGCNEHHLSPYGLMSNCNLIGSILTQRTKKIKIGMLGNLVPISNPLRVAEEYAMIDVMSEGRLIAGLMRGIPHEYVAYNFSPDESRARLAEAMRFIVKAWTEPEPFGWEGEFYSYPAVSIWPRPRQQPHPPIMVSASNEDSARFAAEARVIMGMAFLPNLVIAKEVVDTYRDHAQKTGWTPTTDHVLISCNTLIGEDETEIKNHLREGIRYFGQVLLGGPRTAQKLVVQKSRYFRKKDYATEFTGRVSNIRERTLDEGIEDGVILCGTPDQVVQQIKRVHSELGAGWININMKIGNVPNDVVKRSMELFRDHVLPHVRDLGDGGVIAGAGD